MLTRRSFFTFIAALMAVDPVALVHPKVLPPVVQPVVPVALDRQTGISIRFVRSFNVTATIRPFDEPQSEAEYWYRGDRC